MTSDDLVRKCPNCGHLLMNCKSVGCSFPTEEKRAEILQNITSQNQPKFRLVYIEKEPKFSRNFASYYLTRARRKLAEIFDLLLHARADRRPNAEQPAKLYEYSYLLGQMREKKLRYFVEIWDLYGNKYGKKRLYIWNYRNTYMGCGCWRWKYSFIEKGWFGYHVMPDTEQPCFIKSKNSEQYGPFIKDNR